MTSSIAESLPPMQPAPYYPSSGAEPQPGHHHQASPSGSYTYSSSAPSQNYHQMSSMPPPSRAASHSISRRSPVSATSNMTQSQQPFQPRAPPPLPLMYTNLHHSYPSKPSASNGLQSSFSAPTSSSSYNPETSIISPPYSGSSTSSQPHSGGSLPPQRSSSASPYEARSHHGRGSSMEGQQIIQHPSSLHPASLPTPTALPTPPSVFAHWGSPYFPRPLVTHPLTVKDNASDILAEKRRRNAGASARFRDRRKQREREMQDRCSQLEARVNFLESEKGVRKAIQKGIEEYVSKMEDLEIENRLLKSLLNKHNIPFDERRESTLHCSEISLTGSPMHTTSSTMEDVHNLSSQSS